MHIDTGLFAKEHFCDTLLWGHRGVPSKARPSNCISRSPFLGGGRYEQNRIHSDVCSIYAARGTGSDEEIRPIRRIFVPARGGLSVKREHQRKGALADTQAPSVFRGDGRRERAVWNAHRFQHHLSKRPCWNSSITH